MLVWNRGYHTADAALKLRSRSASHGALRRGPHHA